jgi:large subunit ribosomal protein L15
MASKLTSRSFQAVARRKRPSYQCAISRPFSISSTRQFSVSPSRSEVQYETDPAQRPRWSYTPQKMKAPYPPQRIKDTTKAWECNSDPEKLDRFYIKFLGRGGDTVLTEEVKWQAITHKSFDQGRRGFNDRLAFFGMFQP